MMEAIFFGMDGFVELYFVHRSFNIFGRIMFWCIEMENITKKDAKEGKSVRHATWCNCACRTLNQ